MNNFKNYQLIFGFFLMYLLHTTFSVHSQEIPQIQNTLSQNNIENIIEDEEKISKILDNSQYLSIEDIKYLLVKLQFKVSQEQKHNLAYYLQILKHTYKKKLESYRLKKKIAIIYGREVNLLDGEWKVLPDGKRYWISNEYPEIVLSSAEYSRYWANAITVDE